MIGNKTFAPVQLMAALLLASCAVGPDYQRPAMEAPAAYKEAAGWKVAEPRDAMARGKWWEMFGDSELNALVAQIDVSNQNLKIAEAKYREALALVQSARSGLLPTVSANASSTRSRSPSGRTTTVPADSTGGSNTSHNLSLSANWEIDLWGRIRRQVESSKAGAQASAADLEAARLSLQSELAVDYFQLRVNDTQKQLLDDTVAGYETSLQLTRNRYAVGVADRSDVVQAETQLKSTQAQALDLGVQRAQLEHAIAVLAGKPPGNFSLAPKKLVVKMPAIPVGIPATLLERRPDIAAAERRAAAANAQIGVAKAAYFPTLSFSATGGYSSATLAKWLTAPNRYWSLGPALAETLFDFGRRSAATDQAIASYDQSVASYRETVLEGFQEVEDNLVALRILEQETTVQDDAVRAARESVVLTLNQYKAGTVSYLNVVTVQAALLANERTAVGILGRQVVAAVGLIKALGGGWDVSEVMATK
jgi:NodT family efflux transporter outer membrane factor (OMF) lipoprotein